MNGTARRTGAVQQLPGGQRSIRSGHGQQVGAGRGHHDVRRNLAQLWAARGESAYGPAVQHRGLDQWVDAPRRVRVVAAATVLLLAYGTVVHVVQLLAAGLAPYPELPGWLRGYFIALTVLDPLAAVLLARARRTGVVLAVAVLVTDAAANGWANLALDASPGLTAGRVGTTVITGLALVLLAAARPLWRHAGH